MMNHNLDLRAEVLSLANKSRLGLIGIKPLVGGKLLQSNRTIYIAKYQTGGISLKKKIPKSLTLHKCINYCLDQEGVCTIIPGVHKKEELSEILEYQNISKIEKDYTTSLSQLLN